MTANKTQPTKEPVDAYIASIQDDTQRSEALQLVSLMKDATGVKPVMWGSSIIGFGNHHYVYESGREGDTAAVGFSVRKNQFSLYGVIFYDLHDDNMKLAKKLGPFSHGKGCLYIKSLQEIDQTVLKQMIQAAFRARTVKI